MLKRILFYSEMLITENFCRMHFAASYTCGLNPEESISADWVAYQFQYDFEIKDRLQ
jgi:hypothetical protein